jgi:hypothetical protein
MKRAALFLTAAICALGGFAGVSSSTAATFGSLSVVQQGFTIVGDESWRVVVDVDGTVSDKMNLDIVSHRRVDTRTELADALNGRLPTQLDRLRLAVVDIPRNNAGRLVVSVPTAANVSDPDNLLFGASGVYPVTIELRSGETPIDSAVTFVHRIDTDDALEASVDGALQVMNVASLASAPALTANGQSVASPKFAAELADLVATYAGDDGAAAGAFVSLQADQVAVVGSEALEPLREQSVRHTFSASTFVPMNPAAIAEIGLGEVYASQLRAGEDAIGSAIGTTPDRGVTVIDDKLTAAGAVLLRDVGVRAAILTPGAIDASGFRGVLDSALTYRARAADGSTILVHGIDATYADTLGDTSRTPVERAVAVAAGLVLQRDSLVGMGKDLALVTVALGTTDARPADPSTLQQLFRFVGSSPVLRILDAPKPASVETTGDVLDLSSGADNSLAEAKILVDQLTARVTNTSSMLGEGDPRRAMWPAMLATLLSNRTDPTLSAAIADNVRTSTRTVLDALTLPTAANFTLSSRKSELRLQVRNSSDTALRSVVRFRSAKLKFTSPRQVVEVPPNASAEVVVEVEARSNGRFPVSVQLLTPRGDLALSEPMTITANVSAIAGLGQVVTATALLVLLTWWAHNWRTKRRRALEAALAGVEHPSRLVDRTTDDPKN